MKETFTQPLLPQPRGVVPHAAGDQLAAEQGQPGVLHRLLLRLDEVQEEPQLRSEEQRQSLQGWAENWSLGCEIFQELGSNSRDRVHQTWEPLLCPSLYSNKAGSSSSSAVRSPLQLHHLDSGFSDSGESGNADGNSNGKEMHSEVVHETRTNSFDQR